MKNLIQKFRKEMGITQRDLAAAVGTSQQQIQRIESGVQAARIELAVRICSHLGEPLDRVFPALKTAIMPSRPESSGSEDLYIDENTRKSFAEAGIDAGYEVCTMRFLLRNGYEGYHSVSEADRRRIRNYMGSEGEDDFLMYATPDLCVLLKLKDIVFAHFFMDIPSDDEYDATMDKAELLVYTDISATPIAIRVDQDLVDLTEVLDGEEKAPLQHVFFFMDSYIGDDITMDIEDMNGEYFAFRMQHVSMMTVPLHLVKPALCDTMDEGLAEDDLALRARMGRTN